MQDFGKYFSAISGSSSSNNLRGTNTDTNINNNISDTTDQTTSNLDSSPINTNSNLNTGTSSTSVSPDSIFNNNSGISIGEDNSTFLNILNKSGSLGGSTLINSTQSSLIYTIISNWYLLIAIPAMTITYNVFKALQDHGILEAVYNEVSNGIQQLVDTSMNCPQYIYDIGLLFQCLGW